MTYWRDCGSCEQDYTTTPESWLFEFHGGRVTHGTVHRLQVRWRQAGMLRDPLEHSRADLSIIVKGKDIIGPTYALQDFV
jgi:hypothetical protein